MIDAVRKLRQRLETSGREARPEPIPHLRAAAAQLLLATAAGSALEHLAAPPSRARNGHAVPAPLAWAPALIGPLAAAAHLEHARGPSGRTATAVRILDVATLAVGGALLLVDVLTRDGDTPSRLAPLAFASAGVMAIVVERQEAAVRREQQRLRRRGDIVERLVPRRKARIDRIIVHV